MSNDPEIPFAPGGPPQLSATRSRPTASPLRVILVLAAVPWCALVSLLVINPEYELNLIGPPMPGLAILVGSFIVELLAFGAAYASIGFIKALAQRNGWPKSIGGIGCGFIALALSVLCALPLLLLFVLGPAAATLIKLQLH